MAPSMLATTQSGVKTLEPAAGSGSLASVPEPWSLVLISIGLAVGRQCRRRGPARTTDGCYSGTFGSCRR